MDINPARLDAFLSDPKVPEETKKKVAASLRAREPLSKQMPELAQEPQQADPYASFQRPQPDANLSNIDPASLGRVGGLALRAGGTILGSRFGRMGGMAGAAAGDVAAQGLERLTGAREQVNPRETVAQGALAGVAPGLAGSPVAGALKGAAFGLGSTTLDSLAKGEGLPSVGQLALGTIINGLFTGVGRRIMRPAIAEVSHADVAEQVDSLFKGKGLQAATDAEQAGARDITETLRAQGKLPGIRFRPARPIGEAYRTRAGRFETFASGAAKQEESLAQAGAPFAGGELLTQETLPFNKTVAGPKGTFKPQSGLYTGLPKNWFSKVETRTGLPVYRDVFEPVEQGNVKRIEFNRAREQEASQVFKGLKGPQREAYQAMLEHPNPAEIEKPLQLKLGDRVRIDQLKSSWDRMFDTFNLGKAGTPNRSEQFLTEYLPKLRQASNALGPDATAEEIVSNAFPVGVPREVTFFQPMYENGIAGFNDTDALGILARHANYGSWKTMVEPHAQAATKAFVNNQDVPEGVRETVKHYIEQVHGAKDATGRDLADWLHSFVSHVPGFRRMGVSRQDVKDVTNAFISLPYAGTLGFRPGPLIRNAMQTWMDGYSELGPWLVVGWKGALSKGGQLQAQRLGLLEGSPNFTGEFQEGLQGPTTSLLGKIARGLTKLTSKSLAGYSSVDDANRVAMGLGQYARATRAMQKAHGNVERFIDQAWLDTGSFHPAEREVLKELARKGDFAEAARRSAIAMADNTQWVMRAGNRAPITTGTAGRAIGQYYNWGAYYANYLKRLHAPAMQEGLKMNSKDALRLARFYIGTGLMANGAKELGHHFGIEDAGKRALMWLGPSAGVYTGSTIMDLAQTGLGATAEYLSGPGVEANQAGRMTPTQKDFTRQASSFVPLGGLAKDFKHLVKPDKGRAESVLRTLGVQPRVPRFFR